MSGKKRVAVIFGGQSSEHEVSRVSAQSVINNINQNLYDVVMVGITKEGKWLTYNGPVEKLGTGEWQAIAEAQQKKLASVSTAPLEVGMSSTTQERGVVQFENAKDTVFVETSNSARNLLREAGAEVDNQTVDVIFPVLHGCNGEDGTIQGLFELAGIPYVGSGVLGSAVGMDKAYSKIIFEKEGIPQGEYLTINRKQIEKQEDLVVQEIETNLTYPCFIKPSNAGSSVGVSKAGNRQELIDALHLAAKFDRKILAEEFIDGREIECAVLGNDEPIASTVGEIVPSNEFYDYQAKYVDDRSQCIIPADLPAETVKKIREYAVRAFKCLDCAGLSRVDFFVHKKTGAVYINEINTLPGFTSISMYPKLWEASGISYKELIERLIQLAFERYKENGREINA